MSNLIYLLLFLSVVLVYIHLQAYYKVNNEIDYIELHEPLKVDYERVCKTKIPFSIYYNKIKEKDNFLKPLLCYEKIESNIYLNNENKESPLFCDTAARNIIFINDDVDIKLFPPKCETALSAMKNSVWNTQFLDNIKHLKISLHKNSAICIPPFWYYSFRNNSVKNDDKNIKEEDKSSSANIILNKTLYITYPNILANIYNDAKKSLADSTNFFAFY